MKSIKNVDGITFTKKVTPTGDDIFQEIHERCYDVQMKFGPRFKPLRILLGPVEWLSVSEWMRRHENAFGIARAERVFGAHPERILGYPVGLKRTPGIEFEFSPDCAFEFAQGRVE